MESLLVQKIRADLTELRALKKNPLNKFFSHNSSLVQYYEY